MKHLRTFLVTTLLLASGSHLEANDRPLLVDVQELVFSGVQAISSDPLPLTLTNVSEEKMFRYVWEIGGNNPDAFVVMGRPDFSLDPLGSKTLHISFSPDAGQLGPLNAVVTFKTPEGLPLRSVELFGLSAVGIEGPREPGMRDILETAGLDIDVGWTGYKTHTKAELIGSEIAQKRFQKANPGFVSLTPIARYSPDYLLPVGYYRSDGESVDITPIGSLALQTPSSFQHNCLYPKFASGGPRFDPGAEPFGVFTSSPSHIAYTEDSLNAKFEPERVAHAARVYPAKNRKGESIENAYLVCFEEATNGDYQDYVFLIENVVAVD